MLKVDIQRVNNIGGRLEVTPFNYGLLISSGEISKYKTRRIIGYNDAVGTTMEDVTETSATINLPASAVAMEVVSANANDTVVGSGIQTVEINGLNDNYEEINEVIAMNGTTAVPTTYNYVRINNLHGMRGSVAAGVITLRGAGAGIEYARIASGGAMMLQCLFTIPNNYRSFVFGWSAGATTKDTKILLRAKTDWDTRELTTIFQFQDIMVLSSSTTQKIFPIPLLLPPRCDIKVSALALVAGAQVSASIELIYEKLMK